MKVAVTGGRRFADRHAVFRVLREVHFKTPITLVMYGGSKTSFDRHVFAWATRNRVPTFLFPYRWGNGWRTEIPKRNARLLEIGKPELIIQFPGNAGTYDLVKQAQKANIKILSVYGY